MWVKSRFWVVLVVFPVKAYTAINSFLICLLIKFFPIYVSLYVVNNGKDAATFSVCLLLAVSCTICLELHHATWATLEWVLILKARLIGPVLSTAYWAVSHSCTAIQQLNQFCSVSFLSIIELCLVILTRSSVWFIFQTECATAWVNDL
jgi:hypothetical protein